MLLNGVRVAAAQFEVGFDVAENLRACQRVLETAAARGARLAVLPAYCNHPEWYPDRAQARAVACRPGDEFLTRIAETAAAHDMYVKLHVSLAVDDRVVAANLLFDPHGELIARGDTRLLSGPERAYLDAAEELEPVLDTTVGRLGMYGGNDGALAELPRGLALRGAQVLLASLASVTTDDARLHVPVRAAENKTWVVAANTVGARPGAATYGVPQEWLVGAGGSVIVGPDGGVVARAPRTGETVIVADLEPGWADAKTRPDGGDLFLARRPRLYTPPNTRPRDGARPAEETAVAVVRPQGHGMAAIEAAAGLVASAAAGGAELVVLPELFFYPRGRADGSFLDGIAADMLSQALSGTRCHVVTTLPDDSAHVGVLIGATGVRGRQLQLHASARHVGWQATLADRLVAFDLGWGRLVIVVGDDALYPETFRLAALLDADAVAVPFTPLEPWELALGLPERVAEHRVNVVAAGHSGPGGGGAILVPAPDPTLHAGRVGGFTGPLNEPLATPVPADATLVTGTIHPACSRDREPPEEGTYVVDGRPWRLSGVLGLVDRF
jgi:deaminated glutathione amidase